MTYKAPPNNEGYDLICINPDPRHRPKKDELAQVRIQVKSRYATDCDRGFPVKEESSSGSGEGANLYFGAAYPTGTKFYDNIGNFFQGKDGSSGLQEPDFYTFPNRFIRRHHEKTSTWQKVRLRSLEKRIERYKNEAGFEQIAIALGISRPIRK